MWRWFAAGGLVLSLAAFSAVLMAEDKPAPTTAPATQTVDVGNTRCFIMDKDIKGPGRLVTYEGKSYRVCCDRCVRMFKQEPAKWMAVLDKAPEKYGVKE